MMTIVTGRKNLVGSVDRVIQFINHITYKSMFSLFIILLSGINHSHQFNEKKFLYIETQRTDISIFGRVKCFNMSKLLGWDNMSTMECAAKCSSTVSDLCKFFISNNQIVDKMKSECLQCSCPVAGLDEYTLSPDDYGHHWMAKSVGRYTFEGYAGIVCLLITMNGFLGNIFANSCHSHMGFHHWY